MPNCVFPAGVKECGKPATHQYKRKGEWHPCCESHADTANHLKFEVRKLAN